MLNTLKINGMTCGHCERSVSEEVGAIPGVTSVTADAVTGTAAVECDKAIDEAAFRAAIEEAGYELVSIR